jgi:mannose-1-phosphate guanylyltransferase
MIDQDRWAIILAGREGPGRRAATRTMSGGPISKQFCCVLGTETILRETRLRVSRVVPPERTAVSLVRDHAPSYKSLLSDLRAENIVIQPRNRGTAPAIVYSLLRLAQIAPGATVAIFPSDHYVSNNGAFMDHVDRAFMAVADLPDVTVLLGIIPDRCESRHKWIEPGEPLALDETALFKVRRFWDKPSNEIAEQLWILGCLWNSSVVVAQLHALQSLIMAAVPRLYTSFLGVLPTFATVFEVKTMERLYADLPATNFSDEVLERSPGRLAVLPVCGVEWSDLGQPRRMLEIIARVNGHLDRGAA